MHHLRTKTARRFCNVGSLENETIELINIINIIFIFKYEIKMHF